MPGVQTLAKQEKKSVLMGCTAAFLNDILISHAEMTG